ncbi:hypothetical protein [Breoghania sp. L-A4]|uniref:hypothetical protein n=1 Tax=Breoghania sp. L-A4 TaxID=2304600 RepID=UPI000E35A3D0|nr:hypothetical protein [Breoghania sp. L-A4]AXS40877.1 hypothetical protein D1F64_13560 [Breoghania sp. L-A4]
MVSRSRNTILLPLAFAASVMCGSARADVCMMPGQAFECVGAACDVEAGVQNGQQHEVVEASQRLRVRAIDSNLSTEQSYAELFGVVVSPAADMFVRANMNVRFSGFLTGFGGGVVNFGSISIRAIVRDLDSNTIVASTEIAQHTNQGEFGMGGPEFFENFFGPPAHRDVPFDSDEGVRLEAGRQYGIGISARAEARGGIINNGVSNYFTGGNGVFLNSLKLISWADTTVAGFEDSDGDGLPNIWETDGVTDCDGTVLLDLPGFGAQPNHKDLFVELDWMASRPLMRAPSRRSRTRSIKPLSTPVARTIPIPSPASRSGSTRAR